MKSNQENVDTMEDRLYKYILFDLDGTLSDPKNGITKSVQYALNKMGIIEHNLDKLESFIGPPLHVSFKDFYSLEEEEIKKAIDFYRERFSDKGMYENVLYDGIPELLNELKRKNLTLMVATSKPTVFATEILKYFKIDHYFELIIGSNLDGTRSNKAEIIQYLLDYHPMEEKDSFLMVGDRKHDILGASKIGIESLGVTYGFGTNEELREVDATYIVNSVENLKKLLV